MPKMKKRYRNQPTKNKNIRPELKTIDSMSIPQVAKVLGMTPRWVDSQCRSEKLLACKWGGFWRIAPEHLIEFLKEGANHEENNYSVDYKEVIQMLTDRIGVSTDDTFR